MNRKKESTEEFVSHNFEPVYNEKSRVLILGTFPSVKSREQNFYYGHPQNRFWKMLAYIMEMEAPQTIEEKKAFLLANKIAVWDVIGSCRIKGSSDSSIRDVEPNDISMILKEASIETILANGTKAYDLYEKYLYPLCGRKAVKMPSTSPANAACSLEQLCESYGEQIRKSCRDA